MCEKKRTLEIRELHDTDLPEVAEIEKKTFSMPWSQKGFADALKQKGTCYLAACVDGQIVGYCGFLQVLDEADITNVAVASEYRRYGIGEAMLQELLRQAQMRQVKAMTLEVRESNAAARTLYEKLGFVSCGVRKNFYDLPKENAVIMWKYF